MHVSCIRATRFSPAHTNGLVTLKVETTEAMHAQLLRHRRVSPNWVSHRVGDVSAHLAYFIPPVWYGKNKGMLIGEPLAPWRQRVATVIAHLANRGAQATIRLLDRLGVCQSQAGRYNNHTHMMTGILTATEDAWRCLLPLRLAPDADPTMRILAQDLELTIRQVIETPTWTYSDRHLPYADDELDAELSEEEQLMVCAARIARVSYGNAGRQDKDLRLGKRLLRDLHWSPFDQVAVWRSGGALPISPLVCLPADVVERSGWKSGRGMFDPTPTFTLADVTTAAPLPY